MQEVSLAKATDSYAGARKALFTFREKLEKRISSLGEIVIKVNFVSAERELATTPLDTVRAFVDFIKPFYKGKIIVAEEASLGDTQAGFERFGFKKWAEKEPQVELFDSSLSPAKRMTFKYPGGKVTLSLAQIYLEAPFLVSLCRAKTHDTVVVTLGIKNVLVGAIQGGLSERSKIHQGKRIHWIMKEIAKVVYPHFVVIDGVVGMEGNGPVSGTPKKAGWVVAGDDALAADSLAAYLMGFSVDDIGYFCLLREEKLGKLYPKDKIEIVGESPQQLVSPFVPHHSFEQQRAWRI